MTDDPGEITRYPVAELEDLAKSIIRQAAAREHRWLAWSAFQGAMKDARPDGREFPWEAAGKLTSITPDSAKDVMARMLMAVPDAAERDRLAKIGAREAEILETRLASGGPDPASSGLGCQVCSR